MLAGVGWACDPGQRAAVDRSESVAVAAPLAAEGPATDTASAERGAAVGAAAPPPAGERVGASNPLGELVPPAPGESSLVGVVAQRLPAGGYTYLRIEPERGEPRWVVTMRRDVGPGDRVRVDSLGSRHDFYSRRLDRRFAELVFGVVEKLG